MVDEKQHLEKHSAGVYIESIDLLLQRITILLSLYHL